MANISKNPPEQAIYITKCFGLNGVIYKCAEINVANINLILSGNINDVVIPVTMTAGMWPGS